MNDPKKNENRQPQESDDTNIENVDMDLVLQKAAEKNLRV